MIETTQMRFHFGERDRDGDGPLEAAVMAACVRPGVGAAALMRGVEGFGAKHRLRTDRLLSLSEDTPLVATAVGEAAAIEALAAEVRAMAGEGLIVLEPAAAAAGEMVKVTIWGPRTGPRSPHLAAVAALKRHGAEAATVLLGVDGVLEGERRRARFVSGNQGVPGTTVGIGRRDGIEAAVADVDGAAHLVTYEPVETSSRMARGTFPVLDEGRVRVTLVTSEVASRGSHPLYVEFVHRLRREGAAGATAQRGVWGFRGEREPHGDRVLALRRDVPMVVEVVDSGERSRRWQELALELAGDDDIVYTQSIESGLTLE